MSGSSSWPRSSSGVALSEAPSALHPQGKQQLSASHATDSEHISFFVMSISTFRQICRRVSGRSCPDVFCSVARRELRGGCAFSQSWRQFIASHVPDLEHEKRAQSEGEGGCRGDREVGDEGAGP